MIAVRAKRRKGARLEQGDGLASCRERRVGVCVGRCPREKLTIISFTERQLRWAQVQGLVASQIKIPGDGGQVRTAFDWTSIAPGASCMGDLSAGRT